MSVTVTLNNGASFPLLGLGTWKSTGKLVQAVKDAIDAGYRHIDCAFAYGNENEVGEAIRAKIDEGVVTRADLFVVSKLWNTKHAKEDVLPACKKSLELLGLEYLDLYLIHWPHAFKSGDDIFPKTPEGSVIYSDVPFTETYQAMETLVDAGLTRAIGLSNFNSQQINEVLSIARIKPSVLQVEGHPYLAQDKLLDFVKARGIVMTAYSPLGSPDRPWAKQHEPTILEDPVLNAIAAKYNKTPAQVCLRFQIQRGVAAIPKSVTAERIRANIDVFDFALDDEDFVKLASINNGTRYCVPKVVLADGSEIPRDGAHKYYPFNIEF